MVNEFEFLEKIVRQKINPGVNALGLTDDAAIIDCPNAMQQVISIDTITENVHYFSEMHPRIIARRLVVVNLSDIAAMAAKPKWYLLSLVLNKNISETWLKDFYTELAKLNSHYNISLIGGDTVRHQGPTSLSMTIIGEVEKGKAVTRSGASSGDDLYMTGTISDAALGLKIYEKKEKEFNLNLSDKDRNHFLKRFEEPTPRIKEGLLLKGIATSMIDISDGLIQDIGHIAKNSSVDVEIELEKISIHSALKNYLNNKGFLELLLNGGDDYELVFTAPPKNAKAISAISQKYNITKIGRVIKGKGVVRLKKSNGDLLTIERKGYQH